jgi:hypothetical protein
MPVSILASIPVSQQAAHGLLESNRRKMPIVIHYRLLSSAVMAPLSLANTIEFIKKMKNDEKRRIGFD